jgi:hypothetical protein
MDSLSAIVLLQSMQRKHLQLWLYQHTARQLLQHTAQLVNRRAEIGRTTRFIKIEAHSGEPLNEAADAMAAAAAELDPARAVELDLNPEAVHFLFKERWVEWGRSLREELAQKAAEHCVSRTCRPKRGRGGQEAVSPALPLTASWMLQPDQGWSTLTQVLKTRNIGTAMKQVLQSIARAFLAMPFSTNGVWYPQLHVLSVGLQQRRRATFNVSALCWRMLASGRITT